ncbi:MAG TPA: CsgG/HfaB family protein [Thermoguttaceae bacterium]|nr:CsgG/HfaB family protein [Thermoguttaceae bacterium]
MRSKRLLFCYAALGLLLAAGSPAAAAKVYPAAILPFQERGDDVKGLGAQVTDLLFAELVADERMYLVDREDLDEILKELELSRSGMVKSSEAAQVGQLTGAKILLTGSVIQVDGKLYLVAKIIGTETTRVLGASVKGNVRDELDALTGQLADEVARTIETRAEDLIAKPRTREDRLAAVKEALGNAERPIVKVTVSERHVGQATIDPAAETEIILFCKEAGFEVIDPSHGDARQADMLLIGEGMSEFAARHGSLTSVKARLELKAVDARTGRVVAIDRQTSVEVDLSEQLAGKAALQEAAAEIAERLLPKIVQRDGDKKSGKE